jgi:heme oxygenase
MSATTLSAELRSATKELHTEAERSGIMGALLRGRCSREEYAALLTSLEAIYGALETGLAQHAAHPVLGALHRPGFARHASLRADLVALRALGVTVSGAVPNEAQRYVAQLQMLAADDPPRLLAHAWLRYLGDLNGGQIVARLVRKSLSLPAEATTFYDFPDFADPMAEAAAWREALDAAPLGAGTRESIVDEAITGFRRHIGLFRALAPANAQDAAEESSEA